MRSEQTSDRAQTFTSLLPGFSFGGPLDKAFLPSDLDAFKIQKPEREVHGSDRYWMLEALREATNGIGITHPNPSVGCVIVSSTGKEIARGFTQDYPGLHAESSALLKIQDPDLLQDATLYVTLEPCSHFGNQPPCVTSILQSKLRRVVIARSDPDSRVNGQGIEMLRNSGKEVTVGVLQSEVTAWSFPFFAEKILKRPVVALKWAQTLDGQLADDVNHSQWITGPAARNYSHWLRKKFDAILVGAGTWLKDRPRLNSRNCNQPTSYQPLPILLDPKCNILKDINILSSFKRGWNNDNRSWGYVVTQNESKEFMHQLDSLSPLCYPIRLQTPNWIPELLSALGSAEFSRFLGRPFQSLYVEGGAKTLTLFLQSGYADIIHTFIAPALLGGTKNRIATQFQMTGTHRPLINRFDLISSFRLGADIVMEMVPAQVRKSLFDPS